MRDDPTVCVSVSSYWLGRTLGMKAGMDEFHRQLENPDRSSLPAVRAVHRLRHIADVRLHLDTGATCIGKARSRAFHAAAKSGADVWVSIDDDVEATTDTLGWLLQAVWGLEPRIVLVPCALRAADVLGQQAPILNVQMPAVRVERKLLSGGELLQVEGGGFALVAVNRAAITQLVESSPLELSFRDDDGVERLALFHDELTEGRWWGEDLSFFRRARRAGISVEALMSGATAHAGYPLELGRLKHRGQS